MLNFAFCFIFWLKFHQKRKVKKIISRGYWWRAYGKCCSSKALDKVELNLLWMFNAESFDDIECSFTKSLKETKDRHMLLWRNPYNFLSSTNEFIYHLMHRILHTLQRDSIQSTLNRHALHYQINFEVHTLILLAPFWATVPIVP